MTKDFSDLKDCLSNIDEKDLEQLEKLQELLEQNFRDVQYNTDIKRLLHGAYRIVGKLPLCAGAAFRKKFGCLTAGVEAACQTLTVLRDKVQYFELPIGERDKEITTDKFTVLVCCLYGYIPLTAKSFEVHSDNGEVFKFTEPYVAWLKNQTGRTLTLYQRDSTDEEASSVNTLFLFQKELPESLYKRFAESRRPRLPFINKMLTRDVGNLVGQDKEMFLLMSTSEAFVMGREQLTRLKEGNNAPPTYHSLFPLTLCILFEEDLSLDVANAKFKDDPSYAYRIDRTITFHLGKVYAVVDEFIPLFKATLKRVFPRQEWKEDEILRICCECWIFELPENTTFTQVPLYSDVWRKGGKQTESKPVNGIAFTDFTHYIARTSGWYRTIQAWNSKYEQKGEIFRRQNLNLPDPIAQERWRMKKALVQQAINNAADKVWKPDDPYLIAKEKQKDEWQDRILAQSKQNQIEKQKAEKEAKEAQSAPALVRQREVDAEYALKAYEEEKKRTTCLHEEERKARRLKEAESAAPLNQQDEKAEGQAVKNGIPETENPSNPPELNDQSIQKPNSNSDTNQYEPSLEPVKTAQNKPTTMQKIIFSLKSLTKAVKSSFLSLIPGHGKSENLAGAEGKMPEAEKKEDSPANQLCDSSEAPLSRSEVKKEEFVSTGLNTISASAPDTSPIDTEKESAPLNAQIDNNPLETVCSIKKTEFSGVTNSQGSPKGSNAASPESSVKNKIPSGQPEAASEEDKVKSKRKKGKTGISQASVKTKQVQKSASKTQSSVPQKDCSQKTPKQTAKESGSNKTATQKNQQKTASVDPSSTQPIKQPMKTKADASGQAVKQAKSKAKTPAPQKQTSPAVKAPVKSKADNSPKENSQGSAAQKTPGSKPSAASKKPNLKAAEQTASAKAKTKTPPSASKNVAAPKADATDSASSASAKNRAPTHQPAEASDTPVVYPELLTKEAAIAKRKALESKHASGSSKTDSAGTKSVSEIPSEAQEIEPSKAKDTSAEAAKTKSSAEKSNVANDLRPSKTASSLNVTSAEATDIPGLSAAASIVIDAVNSTEEPQKISKASAPVNAPAEKIETEPTKPDEESVKPKPKSAPRKSKKRTGLGSHLGNHLGMAAGTENFKDLFSSHKSGEGSVPFGEECISEQKPNSGSGSTMNSPDALPQKNNLSRKETSGAKEVSDNEACSILVVGAPDPQNSKPSSETLTVNPTD